MISYSLTESMSLLKHIYQSAYTKELILWFRHYLHYEYLIER